VCLAEKYKKIEDKGLRKLYEYVDSKRCLSFHELFHILRMYAVLLVFRDSIGASSLFRKDEIPSVSHSKMRRVLTMLTRFYILLVDSVYHVGEEVGISIRERAEELFRDSLRSMGLEELSDKFYFVLHPERTLVEYKRYKLSYEDEKERRERIRRFMEREMALLKRYPHILPFYVGVKIIVEIDKMDEENEQLITEIWNQIKSKSNKLELILAFLIGGFVPLP